MITLKDVCKRYQRGATTIMAVNDLSLGIGAGEFVVITGHSGSGKTTLLNLIGGMTLPTSGEIVIAGNDILGMNDVQISRFRAKTIGFAFQFSSVFPTLNVLDNVRLPRRFAGLDDDTGRAESLLVEVGLGELAQAYDHELSEGQKRRVSIARALINEPSLLLCDEPTGDLDPENEGVIMDMISRAHREGATVMLTTHNLSLRSRASRTLRIEAGRVFEE